MRGFQSAYFGRHEFPKRCAEFELRQWWPRIIPAASPLACISMS